MHAKKNGVSMKALLVLLAVVLLVGCVVGGTIAYLVAAPKTVTNTFVAGEIGTLTLTETDGNNNSVTERSFIVIPGVDIEKDPVVSFEDNNVDAYVFVEVSASGWTKSGTTYLINSPDDTGDDDNGMYWTVASGWTAVPGEDHVYYREVSVGDTTREWHIISNDTITVSSGITEDSIADYTKGLAFTAYAIQKDGFNGNVASAWAQAKTAG